MTVDAATVKDWRGQVGTRPVQLRALAAAFRRGETLHESELRILRDYASENGLQTLAERCRQELRTERTAFIVAAVSYVWAATALVS
jgi:hypothetical protein